MKEQAPNIRQYFEPLQIGVGTPLGGEAIIYAAASLLETFGTSTLSATEFVAQFLLSETACAPDWQG
jgi:hypothetical protein